MQLLTGPKVWATIAELSAGAKRTRAAVSRLEAGASELLPLKQGGSLVVDLSSHALAQGQTSPGEVRKYLDGGVDVFRWNGLNANVFLFDRTGIVGSAAVSQRSARGLTEAAFVTRDPDVVADLKGFLDSVSRVSVTAEDLEQAEPHYRRPPSPPRTNDRNPVLYDLLPPAPYRIWLTEYSDRRWPKRAFDTYRSEEATMSLRVGDRRTYLLYTFLLWKPWVTRMEEGDVIVCAWGEDPDEEPLGAWPPAVVVGTTPVKHRTEEGVIVYAKYPRALEPIAWEDYREAAEEEGLQLRIPFNRPLRTAQEQAIMLAPWDLG